jgi:hypothetical protein
MTTKNQWFIVVGRMHGRTEATALPLQAATREEAIAEYQARMLADAGIDDDAPMPVDGEGACYIDQLFMCGSEPPEEM